MPLPDVPPNYADNDLERAFVILARQQLGDLAARLAKAAGPPPGAAALAGQVTAAQRDWQADLAPLGEPNRRQQLRKNVAAANELERKVDVAVPKPATAGGEEAFGAKRFGQLKTAVAMACSVTQAKDTLVANVFGIGNEPAARQQLGEIAAVLTKLLGETSSATIGDRAGFVLANLPETMKALASATPAGGYIRIRPKAFNDPDLYDLATSLVHEASHLIGNPTVDYAYRPGGLFHLLPAKLAPRNAAHFEHLAARFFSPDLADVPASGSTQAKALLVLRFKVTRAWVRANDLTSKGPGLKPVAELIRLDSMKVGDEVAMAVFKALFAAMEAVMPLVQRNTTLTFAREDSLTVQEDGTAQITVRQGESTSKPTAAATTAIDRICSYLSSSGRTDFPALAAYIDGIVAYDRPSLVKEMAEFLTWADLDPVG